MPRLRIEVRGQVQGSGFRPHICRVARSLMLSGWVQNTPSGVYIEVQGDHAGSFVDAMTNHLPPLARIGSVTVTPIRSTPGEYGFIIRESAQGHATTRIPPDAAPCPDCLAELYSPQNRYAGYPFLCCTACGPRFTQALALPWDRAHTAMAGFSLCETCRGEFTDPDNRRFYAQTMACATCGPQLADRAETLAEAVTDGHIVAFKGPGGYQLVCDAYQKPAIARLREIKHRPTKPFAVMVANLASARLHVRISDCEAQWLESAARPIVILKRGASTALPELLAPGLSQLGIMLPASPLHYLLFGNTLTEPLDRAFIVTSANRRGEPIRMHPEEMETLAAEGVRILHCNRPLVTRVDDSVMRLAGQAPLILRRARGFVPEPVMLAEALPPVLALGGHQKSTFCLIRGQEAFVSQHIGNLSHTAVRRHYHETLRHWLRLLDIRPERVACDLHPDYATSLMADSFGLPVCHIQHHHAHLAAVMAEHRITEPAIGLALDGHGMGWHGESLGGELFCLRHPRCEHLGRLRPLPMPGAERAIREPWRMGAGVLHCLGLHTDIPVWFRDEPMASRLAHWLHSDPDIPRSSSCGRLFDAAAALLGLVHKTLDEAEAARLLENYATVCAPMHDGWRITQNNTLNFLPLMQALLTETPASGASLFHATLIDGLCAWIATAALAQSIRVIILGGGCFQNALLARGISDTLTARGFLVYLPEQLPANDGGLSAGQALIAGSMSG